MVEEIWKKKTFDTHTRWCTGIWFYSFQLNPNLLISGIWPQCKHTMTSSNLMFMIGDQTSEIKIFSNKQKSTKIHAMARLRPGCFRWHWYFREWVSCFLPEARLHQRWAQIDKKKVFHYKLQIQYMLINFNKIQYTYYKITERDGSEMRGIRIEPRSTCLRHWHFNQLPPLTHPHYNLEGPLPLHFNLS